MLIARVVGTVVSTQKNAKFEGAKLLLVQPESPDGAAVGATLLAVDSVGAGVARFTGEALPEFERLLGEMSVLAASLRRLSEKMEGSPGGLLMGRRPVPPGPGETAGKEAAK